MYRSFSPDPTHNPYQSADHKTVISGPDDCKSKLRSKAKKALTSVSKKQVYAQGESVNILKE